MGAQDNTFEQMICESCEGDGFVRGTDPDNPGALVMLPCLDCMGSGIASATDPDFCQVCGQPIYDAENTLLRDLLRECLDRISDNTFEGSATDPLVGRIEAALARRAS